MKAPIPTDVSIRRTESPFQQRLAMSSPRRLLSLASTGQAPPTVRMISSGRTASMLVAPCCVSARASHRRNAESVTGLCAGAGNLSTHGRRAAKLKIATIGVSCGSLWARRPLALPSCNQRHKNGKIMLQCGLKTVKRRQRRIELVKKRRSGKPRLSLRAHLSREKRRRHRTRGCHEPNNLVSLQKRTSIDLAGNEKRQKTAMRDVD